MEENGGTLEPSPLDLYWNLVIARVNGLVLSWSEGLPWETSHLIRPLLRLTRFKKMRMPKGTPEHKVWLAFLSYVCDLGFSAYLGFRYWDLGFLTSRRLFSVFNRQTKNNSGSKIFPLRTKLFIFEKTNGAGIRTTKDVLAINYVPLIPNPWSLVPMKCFEIKGVVAV
mgnify:CR=1 FL=1